MWMLNTRLQFIYKTYYMYTNLIKFPFLSISGSWRTWPLQIHFRLNYKKYQISWKLLILLVLTKWDVEFWPYTPIKGIPPRSILQNWRDFFWDYKIVIQSLRNTNHNRLEFTIYSSIKDSCETGDHKKVYTDLWENFNFT